MHRFLLIGAVGEGRGGRGEGEKYLVQPAPLIRPTATFPPLVVFIANDVDCREKGYITSLQGMRTSADMRVPLSLRVSRAATVATSSLIIEAVDSTIISSDGA